MASAAASHGTAAAVTPNATDAPWGVAPPQLFASPFLPEHERALATVLKQIHPLRKISRSTLTILQRVCDRLAHYLIHRAYHGLNSGMRSKLEALSTGTQPSSAADVPASAAAASSSASFLPSLAPSSLSVSDPPHSIHFAFDEPLWRELGQLRTFADGEVAKAQTKLSEAGEAGLGALTAADTYGFFLPLALADRWLRDFTMGQRLTDNDAVLPPSLCSTHQRVSLCAIVEYIVAALLDLSGNVSRDIRAASIQPAHLWSAVENDPELVVLCAFLPVDWRIEAAGVESPLQLACASQPNDAAHHPLRFLEFAFAPHTFAQAELNRSSWYKDSAAVIEAARMAARGELDESSLSRQLRALYVRPFRFWGVDSSMDAVFERACGAAIDLDQHTLECVTVSFLLTDANGREFELILRGHCGGQSDVLCFVLRRNAWRNQIQLAAASVLAQRPARGWPASALSRTLTVDPRKMVGYRPHGLSPPVASSSAATASALPAAAAASSSSLGVPSTLVVVDTSTLRARLNQQREIQLLDERTAAELEAAFRAAIPLLKFSLFGPSLFADNHPPRMRRLFTAHLVDECMLRAGLTPLPLVLSELIADYHSFDLPFRQDKAEEQMSQAGLQLREQNPDKATYEGQLDSAVERVRNAEAQLDQRFPVLV